MKLYILAKATYGDFDTRRETPILISENQELLKQDALDRNTRRSKADLAAETEYLVLPGVPYIGKFA